MKKILLWTLMLISIVSLFGCATVSHIPLEKQNSQSIKTVYVNTEIKKPDGMYEFRSGQQFGLLGYAVTRLAEANDAMTPQRFAEKNKIDIRNIVYQRWKSQLADKSKFKLSTQPTDVVLTTDIVFYGISIPHGFSTDYVPVLSLNAKLVRNNQVIWQDNGSVLPLANGLPRYKMDQIMNDPKKLHAMWDKAAEKIINDMLSDMNK